MSLPPDAAAEPAGNGYRWELDRALRANAYLRVFFSSAVLLYCAFGPGLLIRFPLTAEQPQAESLLHFYAFRPAIFALVFAALACVLSALAQKGRELFEAALEADSPNRPADYLRVLTPSPFPFVLSGNLLVDTIVFAVALAAYAFWVLLLVETTPPVLQSYQVAGVVLGSYGLFSAIIVIGYVWFHLARRQRRFAAKAQANCPSRPA